MYIGLRRRKSGKGPTEGCRAIDERMNYTRMKYRAMHSLAQVRKVISFFPILISVLIGIKAF
jgi:hypothetical protein